MNVLDMLEAMKHSPLHNYAGVPGLTSWLIGAGKGNVRLMECSRAHQEAIIPHSHRFDFVCQVLAGTVTNLLWEEGDRDQNDDEYQVTEMGYAGTPGCYDRGDSWRGRFRVVEQKHGVGATYSMKADQIHSIFFSRGAKVLFLEGPEVSSTSVILEPVVDGVVVPTFDVRDWMFKKEQA